MNIMIASLLLVLIISCVLYDFFRKKYEVFGIIIDKDKGSMGVDVMYFNTYKKAIRCYKEYEKKYVSVCINEIF